jgi:type II restriction/modification system DNA methylase subunit YeeA
LRDNGYGQPAEPILRQVKNITHMDAVLTYDENGKPFEPKWPVVDVIVGNPPFLGGKRMRSELGDKYINDLFELYQRRVPHEADLVCYWFEKARAMIEEGMVKRAGLLATQAIRAGANRKILERIKQTGEIFYAQADRPWILDGASVRVSMVGFDNGEEKNRLINESKNDLSDMALSNAIMVSHINANLTYRADTTLAKRLRENENICFQGPIKAGPFDIEDELAQKMLRAPTNVNGRSNTDVVRPIINATDLVQQSRRRWAIDFGVMSQDDAAKYEMPFEYVRKYVLPFRQEREGDQYAKYWQFLRPRPELRNALIGKFRCFGTPRVAKHRIFSWIPANSIPDSRVYIFARDDDYFFGVLHSRIHEKWSLATSSRHGVGNDPTYNNTTCFETFPFPWQPGKEPKDDLRVQAIAQAAKELVEQRDRWLNVDGLSEAEKKKRTLTGLYNARPTWLDLAHQRLDEAVFAAYGWKSDLSDEEILEKLLALNLERS